MLLLGEAGVENAFGRDRDGNPVLLEGEALHKDYDIAVFCTTSDLSARKVHALYNQRGARVRTASRNSSTTMAGGGLEFPLAPGAR